MSKLFSHGYPGLFIALEGPDCCGKSTQTEKVVEYFQAAGFNVVRTREQGGTPFAEKIRELCKLPTDGEPKHEMTQMLLAYASRHQHLEEVIIPALKRGDVVITDRFNLSTAVFQHIVGGVSYDDWIAVDQMVVGLCQPDHTFIFNVSSDTVKLRQAARAQLPQGDYYDSKDRAFHARIAEAYTGMPGEHIDGNGSIDEVFERLLPMMDLIVKKHKHSTQPPFTIDLSGSAVLQCSPSLQCSSSTDLFRISVRYQDGSISHYLDTDSYDRVGLHPINFTCYAAEEVRKEVDKLLECMSAEQRAGIKNIRIQQFPFNHNNPVTVVEPTFEPEI